MYTFINNRKEYVVDTFSSPVGGLGTSVLNHGGRQGNGIESVFVSPQTLHSSCKDYGQDSLHTIYVPILNESAIKKVLVKISR